MSRYVGFIVRKFIQAGILGNSHLFLSYRIYKVSVISIGIRVRSIHIFGNVLIAVLCINLNIIASILIIEIIILSIIHGHLFGAYQFPTGSFLLRQCRIQGELIFERLRASSCSVHSHIPYSIKIVLRISYGRGCSPSRIPVKENTSVHIRSTGLKCYFGLFDLGFHMNRHILALFINSIAVFRDFQTHRELVLIHSLGRAVHHPIFHFQHTGRHVVADIRLKQNTSAKIIIVC